MNKNNELTLKKMEEFYKQAKVFENHNVIKWYQEPFLWLIWLFKGYIVTGKNWKMYWLDFRGVKYLLKSKELSS